VNPSVTLPATCSIDCSPPSSMKMLSVSFVVSRRARPAYGGTLKTSSVTASGK
jgi:hypothetical protein